MGGNCYRAESGRRNLGRSRLSSVKEGSKPDGLADNESVTAAPARMSERRIREGGHREDSHHIPMQMGRRRHQKPLEGKGEEEGRWWVEKR